MAKKSRKRRNHRARSAMARRSAARQRQPGPASPTAAVLDPAPSGNAVTAARKPRAEPVGPGRTATRISLPATPAFGRMTTALLPGRVFFAIGRPASGFVCCILQATVLGWAPAALWAFQAKRRVADKHRGLAARLRPL